MPTLSHVRSMASKAALEGVPPAQDTSGEPRVRETRLTGLAIHLLVAGSLLLLPLIRRVPMPVLCVPAAPGPLSPPAP